MLLVAATTNSTITAVVPDTVATISIVSLKFSGAIPTDTTYAALAIPGFCKTNRLGSTLITSPGIAQLSEPISSVGDYAVCYTTDGQNWVEQNSIRLYARDCKKHTCADCTASDNLRCRWCFNSNNCDVKGTSCEGISTESTCPLISSFTSTGKGPTVGGTSLSLESTLLDVVNASSSDDFKCRFDSGSISKTTNASIDGAAGSFSCESPSWTTTDSSTIVSLRLEYKDVDFTANFKPFQYYWCGTSFRSSCSNCYDASNAVECGWCASSQVCNTFGECSSLWGVSGSCPSISSISPNTGPLSGGTVVMISGSMFANGVFCRFGNTTVSATVSSESILYCTSPQFSSAGSIDVDLYYLGKPFSSNSLQFLYKIESQVLDPGENGSGDTLIATVTGSTLGFVAVIAAAVGWIILQKRKRFRLFSPPALTKQKINEILFPPPKVKRDKLQIVPALDKLEELIMAPDMELLHAVAKATQSTEMDKVSKSIVHIFNYHDANRTMTVLEEFISREVEESKSQATLFRTNSLATKIFNVYSKILGLSYIHKTLGYILNEMLQTAANVEVDERKTSEEGPMAKFQLMVVLQKILQAILKSKEAVPRRFNVLFMHLQKVIREKYPVNADELAGIIRAALLKALDSTTDAFKTSKKEFEGVSGLENEVSDNVDELKTQMEPLQSKFESLKTTTTEFQQCLNEISKSCDDLIGAMDPSSHAARALIEEAKQQQNSIAIGGFFFLRFLVPTVTTPESYGLLKQPPDVTERRMLVLVAKVLQNLSNNVEFGKKEMYMTKLNDFIRANRDSISKMFDFLGSERTDPRDKKTAEFLPEIPKFHHDAALYFMYDHINLNFNKIVKVMKSVEGVEKHKVDIRLNVASQLESIWYTLSKRLGDSKHVSVLLQGFLIKEGGGQGAFGRKNWKRRWFTLVGNSLAYYKHPDDADPTGVIPIDVIEDVRHNLEDSDNLGFTVVVPDRTYNMRAETEADLNKWIQTLKSQLENDFDGSEFTETPAEISSSNPVAESIELKQIIPQTIANSVSRLSIDEEEGASTQVNGQVEGGEQWVEVWSDQYSRTYYVNLKSKESVWTKPTTGTIQPLNRDTTTKI